MSDILQTKIGKRKIIDFFIRPVKRSINESIKER